MIRAIPKFFFHILLNNYRPIAEMLRITACFGIWATCARPAVTTPECDFSRILRHYLNGRWTVVCAYNETLYCLRQCWKFRGTLHLPSQNIRVSGDDAQSNSNTAVAILSVEQTYVYIFPDLTFIQLEWATLSASAPLKKGETTITAISGSEIGTLTTDAHASLQPTENVMSDSSRWTTCSVCTMDTTWINVLKSDAARSRNIHHCRCVYSLLPVIFL